MKICPLCKSDKAEVFVNQTNSTNYYICDECGIHYSDVGKEKDKPKERPSFSEWISNKSDDLEKAGDGYEQLSDISKKCIDFAIEKYLRGREYLSRPMEFQEWIETDEAFPVRKAFVRSEDGMYNIFKQIYKAGQNSVK